MTIDRAPALTAEEARTLARFDAAPVPPEVVAAGERVETVARALWEREGTRFSIAPWEEISEITREQYRGDAAAAIAADPSPAEVEFWRCARCHRAPEQHAGGRESDDCVYVPELASSASVPSPAEEAVRWATAEEVASRYFDRGDDEWDQLRTDVAEAMAGNLRAALASPAPAPQGPEPCPACGSRTSIHDGNAHATASMTVPAPQGEERACAMCGATDHREWAH